MVCFALIGLGFMAYQPLFGWVGFYGISTIVWLGWVVWHINHYLVGLGCMAYQPLSGGARGVMVIVVGIGHGDTSSNPGRD